MARSAHEVHGGGLMLTNANVCFGNSAHVAACISSQRNIHETT